MGETRVIHVSEMKNFPDAVYIGRANRWRRLAASPLANPFVIGRDGTRIDVLYKYNDHMTRQIAYRGDRQFIEALIACRNRPLACWCRRSDEAIGDHNGCHGDWIIAELTNYSDDELRAITSDPL